MTNSDLRVSQVINTCLLKVNASVKAQYWCENDWFNAVLSPSELWGLFGCG